MNDDKYKVQVKAAEIIVEYIAQDLNKFKSDFTRKLFGISTVQEFNKIPYNTVRIVNGRIEYTEEVIKQLFLGFLDAAVCDNRPVILKFLDIVNNTRIMYYNGKIIKENKRIYNLYISPTGAKNAYERISKEKDKVLLRIKNDSEEKIEFYGGMESYIKTIVNKAFVTQIVEEFAKDMKPVIELTAERNKLLK